MKKRVLFAGLVHETHTFVTEATDLSDFLIQHGEAMYESEGDASSLAGMLEVGRACDWEILPIIHMSATPAGVVSDGVVEYFWAAFREVAERETPLGVDGILLNLHGAMVSESHLDVEGELLRRIRSLPGLESVPICSSLDLHGNITPLMASHATGLIGYRENPHTDVKMTSVRAARLLDRLMQTGERAQTIFEHPPIVWPPSGTGTADEPMRSLEVRAREIEAMHPEILAVSVFGGFSFADIPETGVSFLAVTVGDPEVARRELHSLSKIALARKVEGNRRGMTLEEAMHRIAGMTEGPVLLVEPSDNIGGGAPGDLTFVLQALVAAGTQNAALCLNDPESVRSLWESPIGTRRVMALGGKSGQIGAEPLELEIELLSRSEGDYRIEDPHSHIAGSGFQQSMGRCVVVRTLARNDNSLPRNQQGVRILLTSKKTPPFDLAQWRSQGVDPESLFAIGVKAAVAHRQAYNPIAKTSYSLDTPGPCSENLSRLPYKRIMRPIYPLDSLE